MGDHAEVQFVELLQNVQEPNKTEKKKTNIKEIRITNILTLLVDAAWSGEALEPTGSHFARLQ